LWKYRKQCKEEIPTSVSKVLQAVDWLDRPSVAEMHELLRDWPLIDEVSALQLLDAKFPDEQGRAYACKCLNQLPDQKLAMLIPQLVQACKFEIYHFSTLTQFLMSRALRSRLLVGMPLFWELKVAIDQERERAKDNTVQNPNENSGSSQSTFADKEERGNGGEGMALRYGLLAEAYLRGCGAQHHEEVMKQMFLIEELRKLSNSLKKSRKKPERCVPAK